MTDICYTTYYSSPLGNLRICGTSASITSISFYEDEINLTDKPVPAVLQSCVQQLKAYFAGAIHTFDLPLQPKGTPFQLQVWQQLQSINYGKTASYLDVAKATSREKAIRAVGAANGKNPICIVIPCHRVIGSNGSLTGFSGGLWRKEWLLHHEGVLPSKNQLNLF